MTALLDQVAVAGSRPAATRIVGLDGLRAIAVTAVVLYHLGLGWLPGGFLGVDLFFVISGFLITTLLLRELQATGRINYGQFYLRRARRLLPALLLVLAATLVLAAVLARDVAQQTLRDVPGALLYVSNWWALGQQQSYFALIGRGNLLGHLWSLALEEQFYLIWPMVLGLVALVAGPRLRRAVLIVAVVGAVASTVWMAVLAVRQGVPISADPTRVYFGTDTHAMSVMIGGALASVWNVRVFRPDLVPGARRVLLGAGVLGLGLTALLLLRVTEYTTWLYRGGFLVAAVVFALVVAAVTHPASPLGPALDNVPMRWVGERSYGIYLWHWPIFLVTRPGVDVPGGPWADVVRVGLVLGAAALSYRFVELPVRRGVLGTWWRDRRVGWAVVAAACVVGGLLVTAPAPQPIGDTAEVRDEPAVAALEMAWYGDSVTLWAVDALRGEFPGVRVDAGINRAPTNIMSRVRADGPASGIVVMHLGNAGPVPPGELQETLAGLANAERVVVINSNAAFPYVAQANATVASVAAGFSNVVVVDWQSLAAGHREWFKDGLHLTEAGKAALAAAVRNASE